MKNAMQYVQFATRKTESEEKTMKNVLAFLTEYKAKKAELEILEEKVKAMKAELEDFIKTNNKPDEKGKYKYICKPYVVTITPCVKTWIDNAILETVPEAEAFKKQSPYDRTIVK